MSVSLGGLQLGPRSCPCSVPLVTRGTGTEDAAGMLVLPGGSQRRSAHGQHVCRGVCCDSGSISTEKPIRLPKDVVQTP